MKSEAIKTISESIPEGNETLVPSTLSGNNLSVILRGRINAKTIENLQPNKKLIIFVSSTFTDTFKERNVLQDKILPELQRRGYENDVQVLFYDMRFGIKDESSLDHTTWHCCQEGIRECHAKSDGIFFMSLQGDKYGYRPLPKLVDRSFFEYALEKCADKEVLEICRNWYHLNENYTTAKYELQNLRSTNDQEYWNVVLPRLRQEFLTEIPFDSSSPQLLIGRSITEWEVLLAQQLREESQTGIWIKKEFDLASFGELGPGGRPTDFNDGLEDEFIHNQLIALKEKMNGSFDIIHPLPLQKIIVKDYVTDTAVNKEYLEKWEIVVKNRLQEELERCIHFNQLWKEASTKQLGIPIDQLEEMLQHCFIMHQKASSFLERVELVDEAIRTITAVPETSRSSTYSAITAGIIGRSGAGKTALLSKVAQLISARLDENADNIPIIIRYCGTSKFSLHGKDLIESICLQILIVYEASEEIPKFLRSMKNQKYETAVASFSSLLQRYPVILLIDSVDQLSNRDEARSKLSFLQHLRVHDKTKIIVSTLPDEYDTVHQQWKYRYHCEEVLRKDNVPILEMTHHDINENATRVLLEQLLAGRERKITEDQWSVVLRSASEEPTMLYLNLSLEIITKWRSWEREVELRPTVKGLINQIFEGLERYYGRLLIQYAFGFITFSRDGISDQEMIDCLSRQSEVFQEVCQYWQGVKTIPLHVWLRVKQAIKALLAEKDHACLKWYHRQLWEAAEERYEEVKKDCHRIMGRYFSEQSLCLTELDVWHPESKINSRRVKEGYYHLYESGLYDEAVTEMCSFEMVCASALCDDAYHSLSYLFKLDSLSELVDHQRIDHYYRWVRIAVTSIVMNPRQKISSTASEQPTSSLVLQENRHRFHESSHKGHQSTMIKVHTLDVCERFGNLLANLIGHKYEVNAVCWSPDEKCIASGSRDKTIKIWESATGELLSTCQGHTDRVTCVAWSPDGSKIVSGSWDKLIKIWDASTGELIKSLEGYSNWVLSVAWNHDGSKIASGAGYKVVSIWDVVTGKRLLQLEGHEDSVASVAWNHDGSKIASGSSDATIKIWDSATGELFITLTGPKSAVQSVCWSPDGKRLVSGFNNKEVILWDTVTGEILSLLTGHDSKVTSVSWSKDGSKVVSGSEDTSIKIWDAFTGEVLSTYQGNGHQVKCVVWNADGSKILSGSDDKTVKIWDTKPLPIATTQGHTMKVTSVSWSDDGCKIVSGSEDKTVKIWDATTGELLKTFTGHTKSVVAVAWNRESTLIASGSWDNTVKIWDFSSSELLRSIEGHTRWVTSVAWSPSESILASASYDYTVKLWDATTGEILRTLKGQEYRINAIAWSRDGSKIAAGTDDYKVMVWNAATGDLLNSMENGNNCVVSVAWNHDGTKIAAGYQGSKVIKIWDPLTGALSSQWEGHTSGVYSLAWSPDGSQLASGCSDKTIKVWESVSGKVLETLEVHNESVTSLSWNPTGNMIVSGDTLRFLKMSRVSCSLSH